MFVNGLKKILIGLGVTLMVSLGIILPLRAEGNSDYYLKYIMEYTHDTLEAVNNLPGYLTTLSELALSWLAKDTTDATAELQSKFTSITDKSIENATTAASLQERLEKDFLGSEVTKSSVPFANDLTYSTMLGKLYFQPDPRKDEAGDPAYNYLKNAASLNISHPAPNPNWSGNEDSQKKYLNYYNTISAVQTFNGFLLAKLYTDSANNNAFSSQQNELMKQASNSDWFSQIATEDLGVILRQILMYNSQVYVLLTQMLQVQKQQLAAQAMSNSLLVIGNQFTESTLLSGATGSTPEVE